MTLFMDTHGGKIIDFKYIIYVHIRRKTYAITIDP